MNTKRRLASIALGAAALLLGVTAAAQTYPSKPVRMIMPFPAGSGVDYVARILSSELGKTWTAQTLIDNRPGASGIVAINEFKRSAPDGYNLLLAANDQLVVNRAVYKTLPYDVDKDMVMVAGIYKSTFVVAASAASGIKSVADLISVAKKRPGNLTYATLGKGTLGHISGEQFSVDSGISLLHVPFREMGQLNTAVGSGEVDLTFLTMASLDSQIKAGRVLPLASASVKRQVYYPDVPTMAEAGGPSPFEVNGWLAIMAPRGTPQPVIDKLQADVLNVVRSDAFRTKIAALGFEPWAVKTDEIQKAAADELQRYKKIAARPGMQLD